MISGAKKKLDYTNYVLGLDIRDGLGGIRTPDTSVRSRVL